jgi:hypothetical protein
MRFYITEEGATRLRDVAHRPIDVDRACYLPGKLEDGSRPVREFTGPSIREGLMGGWPRGIQSWAKKQLKVYKITDLDLVESRLLYYVLAIRGVDHQLLPIEWFDDLAITDFDMVQHVVPFLDRDGDCGECSASVDNTHVHIDAGPGAGDLPPTTDPGTPEMTGTETG